MSSSMARTQREGKSVMRKTLRSGPMGAAPRPHAEPAAAPVSDETRTVGAGLEAELGELERLSLDDLRLRWRNNWGRLAPAHLSRGLLLRVMAYRLQAEAFGDLDRKTIRMLERLADDAAEKLTANGPASPGSDEHAESEGLVGSSGLRAANPEAWGVVDQRVAGPARTGDRRRWRIRMERRNLCEPIRFGLRHYWHEVERPSLLRRAAPRSRAGNRARG